MMHNLAIVMIVLATCTLAQIIRPAPYYNGYKVYRVVPESASHLSILIMLYQCGRFDFWSHPHICGKEVDIMVDRESQGLFEWLLSSNSIQYGLLIDDVARVVAEERRREDASRADRPLDKGRISFERFNTFGEIDAYCEYLANRYHKTVSLEPIGKSYEGRELKVIKIVTDHNNPGIFIEAGINGREWITAAQALYIVHQFVEDPRYSKFTEKVNWYILPVANPDGYVFSMENQRLWRKTRSPGQQCVGSDLSHNFGARWEQSSVSNNECSDSYKGKSAFSEPESQAIRDFFSKHENQIKMYLSFRSYGAYLLYPCGSEYPSHRNYYEHGALAELFAGAFYHDVYAVGSADVLYYPPGGKSDEWALYDGGIDFAFKLELPGGGRCGFDPHQNDIRAIVEETLAGIKVLCYYLYERYGQQRISGI